MKSALKGKGVPKKEDKRKGCCVNLYATSGEGVKKSKHIFRTLYMEAPNERSRSPLKTDEWAGRIRRRLRSIVLRSTKEPKGMEGATENEAIHNRSFILIRTQ